jgi:hypothetical protein
MWRERIKAYEQKQNDLYSLRKQQMKAINMKYPKVQKTQWLVIAVWAIGGACISIGEILYFLNLGNPPPDSILIPCFFISLYALLILLWLAIFRVIFVDYYQEVYKVMNTPILLQKPSTLLLIYVILSVVLYIFIFF